MRDICGTYTGHPNLSRKESWSTLPDGLIKGMASPTLSRSTAEAEPTPRCYKIPHQSKRVREGHPRAFGSLSLFLKTL